MASIGRRHVPSGALVGLLVVAAELVEAAPAVAHALQRTVEPLAGARDAEPVAEQRLQAAAAVVGEPAAGATPHPLRRAHRTEIVTMKTKRNSH